MRTLQVGSFFLLLLAVFVLSCGKKSSPTQPNPGGGGGGGTLETFSSGMLPSGAQYVHTFTNTGSFAYRCTIHNGMTGTVQVVASGADDSVVVTTPGMTFSPSTVTINDGGYVRWEIGGTSHTVTRP